MAEPNAAEFLTKKELAELCRCSQRTIDRLLETGDAPAVTRLSSRRVIFHAPSAREWLAQRTVGQNAPPRQDASSPATPTAPQPRRRGRPRKPSSITTVSAPTPDKTVVAGESLT
jgi:predicted DNA-binding transcriptional regulator AlpA